MRIALLTSANGWRGSGVSYAKLARGLQERGHMAHLVTAADRLTRRLVEEGLEVTQIPGRDTGPREVWALRRALRRLRAQAVVADTPRDVRLSFYATALHRARIVYRYNLNYRRPRTHLMDRVYLSRVAACVYQSQYIRDDAVRHAPWMARIASYHVPNGYDTARYAPRPDAALGFRERYRIAPDTCLVLSAAKLTRNKGQEVAITALHRLYRQGRDLVYVVCGDGHREGELTSMAVSLVSRLTSPIRLMPVPATPPAARRGRRADRRKSGCSPAGVACCNAAPGFRGRGAHPAVRARRDRARRRG